MPRLQRTSPSAQKMKSVPLAKLQGSRVSKTNLQSAGPTVTKESASLREKSVRSNLSEKRQTDSNDNGSDTGTYFFDFNKISSLTSRSFSPLGLTVLGVLAFLAIQHINIELADNNWSSGSGVLNATYTLSLFTEAGTSAVSNLLNHSFFSVPGISITSGLSPRNEEAQRIQFVVSTSGDLHDTIVDTSWIPKINGDILVYHSRKGFKTLLKHFVCERCNTKQVKMPRSAKGITDEQYEAVHFLTYIVDQYDTLADVTVFLPGNTSKHAPDLVKLLNCSAAWSDIQPLGFFSVPGISITSGLSPRNEEAQRIQFVVSTSGDLHDTIVDTSWIPKINGDILVYHSRKGFKTLLKHFVCERCNTKQVKMPRSAKGITDEQYEAVHFLTYIVDQYDTLADVTVFLPGNTSKHAPDIVKLLNCSAAWSDIQPLGWTKMGSRQALHLIQDGYARWLGAPCAGSRVALSLLDQNFTRGETIDNDYAKIPTWASNISFSGLPDHNTVEDYKEDSIEARSMVLEHDPGVSSPLCALWSGLNFDGDCPETIFVNYGNSFAVTRARIHARSRGFYTKLKEWVLQDMVNNAIALENLWLAVFHYTPNKNTPIVYNNGLLISKPPSADEADKPPSADEADKPPSADEANKPESPSASKKAELHCEAVYTALGSNNASQAQSLEWLRTQSPGNMAAFGKLFEACESTSSVTMLVMGGSMTAGVLCSDSAHDLNEQACSYSARFATWLNSTIANSVMYINEARGGTTSDTGASILGVLVPHLQPDIIMTDYSINDILDFESKDGKRGGMIQQQQLTARALSSATEALILGIRKLAPQALHVIVFSQCPRCMAGGVMYDAIVMTAKFYMVPLVDFYAACAFGDHCKWTEQGGSHGAHPPWQTHQAYADAVAYVFQKAYVATMCEKPASLGSPSVTSLNQDSVLSKYVKCLLPKTRISAFDATIQGNDTKSNDGWRLYEDRPGKPGWITTTVDSIKTFKVAFGDAAILAVKYLRSYDGLGDVEMSVRNTTIYAKTTLRGLWLDKSKRISTTQITWFQAADERNQGKLHDMGVIGFGIKPNATHEIDFRFTGRPGTKFKLIEIMAC
ncbi:hypothetical protein CYMTET_14579 [Cymbomonas tetramitiformis]|uniref:Uncharacterized protein n=1 Tax=Cymbomonas tetramitiformis TaxID=36881 RepID=A0AAE0GH92_9CHLO|nr:hypothetical protein CYMTET_14579 [Cymbomonas tetramitiformis]